MEIKQITDIKKVHEFLLTDPHIHVYEFAHLNTGLSKGTKWLAACDGDDIKAIAMSYESWHFNLLHFCEDKDKEAGEFLARGILPVLPDAVYGHVSDYIADIISAQYDISSRVLMRKMKLTGDILLDKNIRYAPYTYKANLNDFEILNEFLKSVNPHTFFNEAMLNTGKYFVIRKNNELIAMAGVHFFNKEFRAAAVGNVVTAEAHRGKGYGGSVTASLCRELWGEADIIGMHVKDDNIAAIKAYEKMGFLLHYKHFEIEAKRKK